MKKVIFLFLFIFIFLTVPLFVLGGCPSRPQSCRGVVNRWIEDVADESWYQYRCTHNCGGEFQRQECYKSNWREYRKVRAWDCETDEYGNCSCSCETENRGSSHSRTSCGVPGSCRLVSTEINLGGGHRDDPDHRWSDTTGIWHCYPVNEPEKEEDWQILETGQPWQKCIGSSGTTIHRGSTTLPTVPHRFNDSYFNQCDGDCIGTPLTTKIFTNPTKDFKTHDKSFLSPEDWAYINKYQQRDWNNIRLPFFIDWSVETISATVKAVREYLKTKEVAYDINAIFYYIENNIIDKYYLRAPGLSPVEVVLFDDNFERTTLTPWIQERGGSGIGTHTYKSATRSMFIRASEGETNVDSPIIDLSDVITATLSIWIRAGGNFSEFPDPEHGDFLEIKYLNRYNEWKTLKIFNSWTAGQIFEETLIFPNDANHSGFQLRVHKRRGNNCMGGEWQPANCDFWHIDDVKIIGKKPGFVKIKRIGFTYSTFWKQPSPCFFKTLKDYNAQIRVFCHVDSGWDTTNASRNRSSGWGDNRFKTSAAPEIRSIFGDSANIIPGYITRNDKLPGQNHSVFENYNIDIDWEGLGMVVKNPKTNIKTGMMPPIVVDWCPIDKEVEVGGIETERKRLQEKTKEMLIEKRGFKKDHKFPEGFRTKYRIAFYECKEEQDDECIEWKTYHFRYEGLVGELVNYTLIFFKQREKTIFPDFFLDQNRFFLTYNTKYRVAIMRCGHIYQKGREVHDGEGLFCFDPSQKWHFKTRGDATNLNKAEVILVPVDKNIDFQSLPFRIEFRNVPGANYYKFMISRLGVHLGLIAETGFIRDNRLAQPLDAHFRPYNPPPAIKSDLVFTYPGGGGDVFLKLDQLYSLYLNSCLTDRAYFAVDGSIVGKDCDPMPTEVRFRTPGSRATNLGITSDLQDGKAIIPVTFGWNRPTGVRSFRIDLYREGEFLRSFTRRESNINIEYPDLVLNQPYKIKVWSCTDEDGKVCVDRFGGNIIQGLSGYRGDEYARLLPSPIFNTFILKSPTGLEVYPEGDEVVPPVIPPILEGQVRTEDFIDFTWNSVVGGAFYQIEIKGPAPVNRVITRIVNTNNFRIHQKYLVETGNYTWKVRACIDKECKKQGETTGDWSQTASFHILPLIEKEEGAWYGLVVCGLLVDNPNTEWNDREACTIRHIPLTIYVIIDFILWRVVPLIMVLLIILTAFFYYTAFANAEEIDQITPKVKKMWKNFAIGFFLLFFAFTIINIFLGIINFNIDLFGRWYEI